MIRTKKSNADLLNLFISQHFKDTFKFRKYQRNAILSILNYYDENPKGLYLLDAPTGSGKSIIAICVAGVLSYKGKDGYLLASDLSLQDQYEIDIQKNKLGWGSVKGVDNYICDVNFERHSLGDCKIKNLSKKKIEQLPCYATCGYFSNRERAAESPVSLLNYSYWLIQRNYVAPRVGGNEKFTKRKFIIADEAHKITSIVQNHFSPVISDNTTQKIEKFREFMKVEFSKELPVKSQVISKITKEIYNCDDKEKISKLLKEFEFYLVEFLKLGLRVKENVSKDYEDLEIPKNLIRGFKLVEWLKDMHCKFEDYNKIINTTGFNAIVKNQSDKNITFNCIDESFLMGKYFHQESEFRLLMTATMGDPENFAKQIDVNPENNGIRYSRIPSMFNFDKSPIYIYTNKRMTFKNKEDSLPWVINKIKQALNKHSKESGIIHSGSYQLSRDIYESLPYKLQSRIIIYNNSEEKKEALKEFEDSENKVLMGPSLLEGLDLGHHQSRFQIFAKVPFPSLADNFVKEKMLTSQFWYDWKSILSILQGVGRSVRSEDDWAITYFFDACIGDLINRNRSSFPEEFLNRIKIIKAK